MMDQAAISIRYADVDDAAAIARVQAETWESTYADLLPKQAITAQYHPRNVGMWRRILKADEGGMVLVADIDGQVIGFASSGTNRDSSSRFTGEIFALYVLKLWQDYGIGNDLFEANQSLLMDEGHSQMMVWVLVGNPAAGFYERKGGLTIAERDSVIGGEKVRERGYGWWLG